MKKGIFCLVCIFMFLTTSCGIFVMSRQPVERGMTMEKVRSIKGYPDYRSFDPDCEQWEYRSVVRSDYVRGYDVCIIRFKNGVVYSMDSFFEESNNRCDFRGMAEAD